MIEDEKKLHRIILDTTKMGVKSRHWSNLREPKKFCKETEDFNPAK